MPYDSDLSLQHLDLRRPILVFGAPEFDATSDSWMKVLESRTLMKFAADQDLSLFKFEYVDYQNMPSEFEVLLEQERIHALHPFLVLMIPSDDGMTTSIVEFGNENEIAKNVKWELWKHHVRTAF